MTDEPIRILGAGGHAKVAAEAWLSAGGKVVAFHDDRQDAIGTSVLEIPVAANLADAKKSPEKLHIAIGDNRARQAIAEGLPDARFPPVIHATAVISRSSSYGAGTLICANAVVQAEASIGRHVIINTASIVEHDVRIGDFAHIAPGVRLGGGVGLGEAVLVGLGAVIMPQVQVGANAVIGAGAVVTRDVAGGAIVAGVPARPLGACVDSGNAQKPSQVRADHRRAE